MDNASKINCEKTQTPEINLRIGAPSRDVLQKCSVLMSTATQHTLSQDGIEALFRYGPDEGSPDYLLQLSSFLSKYYRCDVRSENLFLTCGASHGLHLLISALLPTNAVVFIEDPTYHLAINIFRKDFSLEVVPVRMAEDGVDVCDLEQKIYLKHKLALKDNNKLFWGMFYTIPTFHNPTGLLMTDETSRAIINIARKYDILVVCDDVYNLLNYKEDKLPPRLLSYDRPLRNVLSNGSFSKLLSPGIRIGWIEASTRIVSALSNSGVVKSGGPSNHYTSGVIATALKFGLVDSHLKYVQNELKLRMLMTCAVLRDQLPSPCTFKPPSGGYFVWIEGPEALDATKFNEYLKDKFNVSLFPGPTFSANGNHRNCMRISIAYNDADMLKKGLLHLCEALRKYLEVYC